MSSKNCVTLAVRQIGMQLPPIRSVTEIVDWKSDVEKKLNNKFMNSQMKIRWGNNYNDDS